MELRTHSRVGAIADAWDELADRTSAAPWLRPGWTEVWSRAFGRGRLEILAVHRGGDLVAVCPTERRAGVRAAAANWHSPTFAPLADGDEAREAIARALLPGRLPMVALRPLPAEDPAAAALLSAAERARCRTLASMHMRSPYVALDGSFEAFCAGKPPGRGVLKDVRRNRRGLEAEGEVALEVHDGAERLDAVLAEGFAVEAAGWQGARATAIASDARTRGFYAELARWAAPRGLLRIMLLRVGARAVAFEFCLLNGRELADLKGGYRSEYRSRGPGMIMAFEVIRWAYGQGLTRYDFLGGDEPYKRRWTDHVRERSALRIFPRSVAGLAAHTAWRHGRPVAQRMLTAVRRHG
jgi:CelD/BcsL family acetyltransferase involved in cellulose biosynthesis